MGFGLFSKKEEKAKTQLSVKDVLEKTSTEVDNSDSIIEVPVQSDKELMQTCLVERVVTDEWAAKNESFKNELDIMSVQAENLKKAGLTKQYEIKSREVIKFMADAVTKETVRKYKEQGYIVVRVPPFTNQVKNRRPYNNGYIRSYDSNYVRFNGLLLHRETEECNETYLVRCDIDRFMGEVPDSVVQEIIKVKNEGLTPEIWFVSKAREVENYMEGAIVRPVDPILVGISEKLGNYAVVRAIWGKDIEDIDAFFSKTEDN